MGRMPSHRDLEVWQRAVEFVRRIYEVTAYFPDEERFNLTSPLRRACTSVPANIAEGHGRGTDNAFAHHLNIALGSLAEVGTFLYLAHDLGYLSNEMYEHLVDELTTLRRMLYHLYQRVRGQR